MEDFDGGLTAMKRMLLEDEGKTCLFILAFTWAILFIVSC